MSHSSIRASVETCPPKLHNLFQFSLPFHPEPEILWASPPPPPSFASFCDTRISSLQI